ncbi:hypothetical protein FRC05_008254 [Tulasnella sp. 425]|nr:hypothetical protein FRC05_008254 [Tulasnella sp. 425]
MAQLPGQIRVFSASDGGQLADAQQREKVLGNFMAPTKLELKVGAQVMLIKNTDEDLVNGSVGRVIGFCDPAAYRDEIKRLDGVFDTNIKEGQKAYERKQRMIEEGRIEECPVVKFKVPGRRPSYMCVGRDTFKMELPNGEVQVSRSQVRSTWSLAQPLAISGPDRYYFRRIP